MMDTAVKVALIISIAPTVAALVGLIVGIRGRAAAVKETKIVGKKVESQLVEISVRMNGRLDELLQVTRSAGFNDGRNEALKETAEQLVNRPHRRSDDVPPVAPAVKVVIVDQRGVVRSGAAGGGPGDGT